MTTHLLLVIEFNGLRADGVRGLGVTVHGHVRSHEAFEALSRAVDPTRALELVEVPWLSEGQLPAGEPAWILENATAVGGYYGAVASLADAEVEWGAGLRATPRRALAWREVTEVAGLTRGGV